MPTPKPDESRDDFVARCIPIVMGDDTADNQQQAVAICNSMWEEADKGMSSHERMLDLVKKRAEKRTEFNYGILTADRYVKRFLDEMGVQACYRHMCRTAGVWASFDDVMKKASGTLSYINADMEVGEKRVDDLPSGIEKPKNMLMAFRHVLTTSKKDRDGDILRTKGAKPDPKMLLLWQHVHTLPIGKALGVADHTKDRLELYSCIVDMNDLCHDSAVMVDNDIGRFSHGFRTIDFDPIKSGDDEVGFDVKEFEIMEESLVSVPANPDAETEEVLLSMVEGGKLTSPLMKDYGQSVRERRNISVPVTVDMKLLVNGKEFKSDEDESRDEKGKGSGTETGPSEKAEADADEASRGKEKSAEDKEVKNGDTPSTKSSRPTYPGDLSGSWEMIGQELYSSVRRFLVAAGISLGERDWTNLVGTFNDYAIVCVERNDMIEYYKIGWKMIDGAPMFHGEPKQVEIEVSTEIIEKMKALRNKSFGTRSEKRGRILSKANEGKIREAIADLKEAGGMDGVSRGCKALISQARRSLGDVLESLGTDSDNDAGKNRSEMDVKQAIAVLLASGGDEDLKVVTSVLKAIENGRENDVTTKQYVELLASS